MYAKIMNVAKSMFSWVIVSRECDGSNMVSNDGGQDMVSTMVSNGGGSMDSNGGAQYTNDYASDDEFEEEEEVSYNTAAVVSGLFARQYRRAMKDIARKEALLVEEEHEAGELSDGESLYEVRKLRAEYNLDIIQLEDLEELIKRKKLQLESLRPRLEEAEAAAERYNRRMAERKMEEPSTDSEFELE